LGGFDWRQTHGLTVLYLLVVVVVVEAVQNLTVLLICSPLRSQVYAIRLFSVGGLLFEDVSPLFKTV